MSYVGRLKLQNEQPIESSSDEIAEFPAAIRALAAQHRPSRMPFFRNLAALDHAAAADPSFLGRIHLIYQAAMHATRAAVYFLPHLDPALRRRKLRIFLDDDGLPGGETHHYQLTRAFRNIGAKLLLDDEEFGDLEELCEHLEDETAQFVCLAKGLYSRSLGPWCAIEVMSDDWMRGFADALSVHFRQLINEPYFAECFSEGGRRAACGGVAGRHRDGSKSSARVGIGDVERREDHSRGTRRGLDPSGPNSLQRRPDRRTGLTVSCAARAVEPGARLALYF